LVLSDDVINEIKDTALDLFNDITPWFYDDKFLLTYNSEKNIKLILKQQNIELHKKKFQVESFCGLLFIDELGTTVLVNENHIPSRQLFTIAHELGHYFLHRNLQSQFLEQGLRENIYSYSELIMERQANLFASELLIPVEVLGKMLEKRFSFYRIAKLIGVSKEALKWRIHRYLQEVYNIDYKFALMLVEEYKDKSLNQRTSEALMFAMSKDKFVLFEIFEALCGRDSYIENFKLPTKIGVMI
jgi:Zn-dependent peptidase ImmA (M78 family)